RHRKQRLVAPGRPELESMQEGPWRLLRVRQDRARDLPEIGLLAREQRNTRVEDPVARGELGGLRRQDAQTRPLGVDRRQAGGLVNDLTVGLVARLVLRIAAEEP